MKTILRQISSFLAPLLLCGVVPYFVVRGQYRQSGQAIFGHSIFLSIPGAILCCAGLWIFILSVRMVILIGKGTIMPWDPTHKLVTASLYGYVRNPMILSVIMIEVGEGLLFASSWLGLIAVFFFAVNQVYFIKSEEPGLEKRFGEEYIEYKRNVPRWIPRLTPWHPNQ